MNKSRSEKQLYKSENNDSKSPEEAVANPPFFKLICNITRRKVVVNRYDTNVI